MLETKEHVYLAGLMEKLEMDFGMKNNIEMTEIDNLNEEMGHTMLDNILLEWELEDDDDMGEVVRKECQEGDVLGLEVGTGDNVDECIKTITCEGTC